MSKLYRTPKYSRSKLTGIEVIKGEPIEHKIERIVHNKEPIKDGAPEIFTERKDGVISAYNIRTDRWEIASEAMDLVSRSRIAQRDSKPATETKKEGGDTEQVDNVSEAKPIDGKVDTK